MERTQSIEKKLTTPSIEVLEKPVRRRFSTPYKLRILAETDGCTEIGQIGELPRQNGAAGELPRLDLTIWALIEAGCESNAHRSQSGPPLPRRAAGRFFTDFGGIRLISGPFGCKPTPGRARLKFVAGIQIPISWRLMGFVDVKRDVRSGYARKPPSKR